MMNSYGMLPTGTATWRCDRAMLALERSSSHFRIHHQLRRCSLISRSMPSGDEEKDAPLNPSGNQLSAIIRCAVIGYRRRGLQLAVTKAWLFT